MGFLVGVCSCLTLCWAERGFLARACDIHGTVSIIARRFQAHSTTCKSLTMGYGKVVRYQSHGDTTWWRCTRIGREFARLRGARDPPGRRGGWRRACEWLVSSIGCSRRVPECREAFRHRLSRDSAYCNWEGGIFAVPAAAVAGLDLDQWYSSRSPPTSKASWK